MRHERHHRAQFLLHFRDVPMVAARHTRRPSRGSPKSACDRSAHVPRRKCRTWRRRRRPRLRRAVPPGDNGSNDEQRRRRIAAGICHEPRVAHVVLEEFGEAVRRAVREAASWPDTSATRWPKSLIRNAPDRSITRTPLSTSGGASSAAAFSGTARNVRSVSSASRCRVERFDLAVPDPGQAGQRPGGGIRARRHGRDQAHSGMPGQERRPAPDPHIPSHPRYPPVLAMNKYSSE